MEIVRLPVGEQAPVDADCIRIEELTGSTFKLTASALCVGSDDGDSVSILDGLEVASVEEAEAAGITWAADVGVKRLFISMGTSKRPLKTLEIDKPLYGPD